MDLDPHHITHDRRGWHIDKGISIATIISTLVMFVTLVGLYFNLEKRVSFNEYIIKELVSSRKELLTEIRDYQEETQQKNQAIIDEMRRTMRDRP